jgi:STE24 endopeptidase
VFLLVLVTISVSLACGQSSAAARANQQAPGPSAAGAGAAEVGAATAPAPRVAAYTLSPERDRKARAISKVRLRLLIVDLLYGLAILVMVLRWRVAAKYRDIAENVSRQRILQVMVFAPLLVLTIDALSLPTEIYGDWIQRVYGLSVQGWGSWFWDWTKGQIISLILSTLVIWILYRVIRRSPRRWWFYFWLASLPLILAGVFLQPLVIDPLFHKFEPLAKKDPALTAELEKMVARAGEQIPSERMFWMGAREKTTALNAYVTGFGASKRIVVWDTTIAKLNTPQIMFVAGHEMGHYALHHIPKGLCFIAGLLFVTFYVGYRLIGWVLARWGQGWGIRGLEDWASLPALLLLLSIISMLVGPIGNTFSRYVEHQADQYGLEVTHGLTPDSGEVAAQSFNIMGDVNLSDPEPGRLRIFLFYDHPAIPDRIQFCLKYDPWAEGKRGEFVK